MNDELMLLLERMCPEAMELLNAERQAKSKMFQQYAKRIEQLDAENVSELSEVTHRAMKAEYDCEQLRATIRRVKAEVRNIDETFSHPYTTSREAYRNIRSIVECLHKALGEAK